MTENPSKKRLLVLDRDLLTCQAIGQALQSHPDFEVTGNATTTEEAREAVAGTPADYIVASGQLPAEDLLSLVRSLREDADATPGPRLIVTGLEPDEGVILHYLESGVGGYTLGEFSLEGLAMIIRLLDREEAVVSPRLAYLLVRRVSELADMARDRGLKPANLEDLTRREREVLEQVALGLTNREVAKKLYVSVGTVKSHVHKILNKLGVRSREEAGRVLQLREATGSEEGRVTGTATGVGGKIGTKA